MAVQTQDKYALLIPPKELPALLPKAPKDIKQGQPAIEQDLFDAEPLWGGGWAEFFKKFEGHANGLTRTDVSEFKLGDPLIFSTYFQEAVSEAIRSGILREIEIDNSTLDDSGPLLVVQADLTRKLFLNELSPRLKQLMSVSSDQLEKAVGLFKSNNFGQIASEYGLKADTGYIERIIDFFASNRAGQTFTMTDFYNESRIYPDPDSGFMPYLRNFIDNLIFKAVHAGILEQKDMEGGRPVFSVPKGLQEYILMHH